jgi:acyl dehydratase
MLRASELVPGATREQVLTEELTHVQIVQYAGASGDYSPAHSDPRFAQASGYPNVFAPGMLTMGMTGRVLTDWFGDGRLLSYSARFLRQVWPGDRLLARATLTLIEADSEQLVATFTVVTTNQHGDEVLTGGGTARLDP